MHLPSNDYRQDEHGKWWWYGAKQRQGCKIARCIRCDTEFVHRTNIKQRYCSRRCHYDDRIENRGKATCPVCGTDFTYRRGRPKTYCSRQCAVKDPSSTRMTAIKEARQSRNPKWGGNVRIQGGYRFVYMPEHPDCQNSTRQYVAEHRLVMEQVLGRYLRPTERIHHKDGNKHNNSPENLELWEIGHPAGQRAEERSETIEVPTMLFVDLLTAFLDPTEENRVRAEHWLGYAQEILKELGR